MELLEAIPEESKVSEIFSIKNILSQKEIT